MKTILTSTSLAVCSAMIVCLAFGSSAMAGGYYYAAPAYSTYQVYQPPYYGPVIAPVGYYAPAPVVPYTYHPAPVVAAPYYAPVYRNYGYAPYGRTNLYVGSRGVRYNYRGYGGGYGIRIRF